MRKVVAALVLVAACSNGGGGTVQDLSVLGVDVQTPDPQVGHELAVLVDLLAGESDSDVSVLFLIASRAEVDAGLAEPALEVVDSETIATVLGGENWYRLTLDVPEDTVAPGDYYLIAIVDPLNVIKETDEEDNSLTADQIVDLGVPITFGGTAQGTPDIVIESIHVDDPVVETDVSPDTYAEVGGVAETPNSDFGVTATVRASAPGPLPSVGLAARLNVPGVGLFDLEIWDPVAGAFAGTIAIDSLVPTEPTAIHLDLRIPDAARDTLALLLPSPQLQGVETEEEELLTFAGSVFIFVDPLDQYPDYEDGIVLLGDEDGTDNVENAPVILQIFDEEDPIQAQVAGATPDPKNELRWDIPYIKDFSNQYIGVAVRFGATADVGTKGILAQAGASVPMTIVGYTIDLLALEATGLFNPLDKKDNGFVVALKALTITLWEKRTKEDEELKQAPLTYAKEKAYTANFTVGPVPMFVRIGARGNLGLDVGASVGSNFEIHADPFLNFTIFAEGGPGGSIAGWTLGGGVGADMKLIDDRFHAGIMAGVTYDSATSIMTGSITEEVTNDLKGPSGRVYLFATAAGKILWASFSKRWEYVLTTWKTFERKDTLFNETQSLSVTIQ